MLDGDVNNLKKKIEPYLKNLKLIVHPTLADTNNELKLFFKNLIVIMLLLSVMKLNQFS